MNVLSKEQKHEIVEQYHEGRTLRAIAADYGVTYQRIQQIVTENPHAKKRAVCVYPGLRKWVADNDYTVREVSELTGINQRTLYSYFVGSMHPPVLVIQRILEVTGMSFEEAFLGKGERHGTD